jgi:ferrochelatase
MTIGVLLVQLGTPDEPTPEAVRRYLREFLSDRRVVDVNPWLWKPILHGIILRTRPKRSAALYARVWTEAGSPLLVHTRAQAEALQERLGDVARVRYGMRYGNPGMRAALDELAEGGAERVVVLPLFPQYCTATTLSVVDVVEDWSRRAARAPATDVVESFADHPAWIEAQRQSILAAGVQATPEAPLLMSFHGIPQRYADRGDPYPEECERTARALAASLGLADDAWRLVYQSRFGREAWLQPYTDDVLAALPAEGVRAVSVCTPSFVADCLETIDEIGRESRAVFERAGGAEYVRAPCPNASEAFVGALEEIVRPRLAGDQSPVVTT